MSQQEILAILAYVLIFAASLYVFAILPQQIQRRRRQKMLNSLSVGDEVVTVGGLIGRIRRLEENEVVLDLGRDVQVRVMLSGIAGRRQGGKIIDSEKPPERARAKSRRK